jgi:CRISPR/Cas system CSM-associated protein Csm4 (group 5 of RAMP superfamily)
MYTEAETRSFTNNVITEQKRPGFIARWLFKKLVEGANAEKNKLKDISEKAMIMGGNSVSVSTNIDQPDKAIHFTVYNANGGRVVEIRRYDKRTDRNQQGLYVITSDKDFGHEIDKIITLEALKA